MNSRMSRFYEDSENTEVPNTRYHRNENLYREINKNELTNFNVKSNATVLGEHNKDIDVDAIKKILDTKYNSTPKRKSIRLEEQEEIEEEKEITKEYDINIILERAKEEKRDNYEEERLKKLRDTQFDILKNLDVDKNNDDRVLNDEVKELIDTIISNKKEEIEENKELDILDELKGTDNTEVYEGLKEEVKEVKEKNNVTEEEMINSFYTSSNALKEKDFDELEDDFSKSIESNNLFLKIAISIIVIIFLVGVLLIVKTIYFK